MNKRRRGGSKSSENNRSEKEKARRGGRQQENYACAGWLDIRALYNFEMSNTTECSTVWVPARDVHESSSVLHKDNTKKQFFSPPVLKS